MDGLFLFSEQLGEILEAHISGLMSLIKPNTLKDKYIIQKCCVDKRSLFKKSEDKVCHTLTLYGIIT